MATARSVSNLSVVLSADTAGATKGFRDVARGVDALGQKVQSKNIFNPLDEAANTFFKGFSTKNLQLGGQLHDLHLQATTLPKKTAAAIHQATAAVGGGGGRSPGAGGGGGSGGSPFRVNAASLAGGALGGLFGGKIGGVGGFLGGMFGGPVGAAVGGAGGTAIDATIGAVAGALSAGAKIAAFAVKEIVQVGAEYEMAMAVFSAATGSDESGKSILKGLQNLAAGTIFSSQQLSHQARILMGYGVEAENLVPTMTKLALIAQKTGRGEEGLGRVALAFGQVKAANRLFGTELRQFTEAGVGVNEFAKTMGVSVGQFRDLVESGSVGFNVVAKTINRMGTESETVAQKMNRTLTGSFNAVKDLALQAFGEIGLGIIKAFDLPGALQGVAGFLTTLPEKAKELYPYLEKARDLLTPIATGLYAGLRAAAEAGKNLATNLMPSMQTASEAAKNIGSVLAIGIGKAIDMTLALGRRLSEAILPMAMMFDRIMPYITDVKLPSMTQAAITTGAAIAGAQKQAGPGGYEGMARKFVKEGLPSFTPFNPTFDQSGTTVPAAALPKAISDLAKSINESALTGQGQKPPYMEFATNFGNLQQAEAAGLIQSKGAADSFLYQEFKKLTGSMGRIENTLPAAIDRFTVEGQARIDKVIANMQNRGTDDVPDLLRRAHETAREQLRIQKETVDAIRKTGVVPLVVGG